jgi:chitin disaccharide deacetylase
MIENKLIINADDFGINSNVNEAIVKCFQKDIINSTTVMANMDGFAEAIELAKLHRFTNCIGLHINLIEGKSLTDLSGTGFTDEHGIFIKNAIKNPKIFINPILRKKIKSEILTQYNKLLENGIQPTHLDSHVHVHILPYLVPIFVKIAKETNQKIRIVTVTKRKNIFIMIYNTLLNRHYKAKNIHFSDKFGNAKFFENYLRFKKDIHQTFEIMVHPAMKGNEVVEIFANVNLEDRITKLKEQYQLKISEASMK